MYLHFSKYSRILLYGLPTDGKFWSIFFIPLYYFLFLSFWFFIISLSMSRELEVPENIFID